MNSATAQIREEYVWYPQSGPQHAFVTCPFFDVLFGGARGGGKSDGCLGEFALHAKRYGKDARGVFMRREMPQADSLIDRSQDIYGPMGWTYQKVDRQWTATNGAILRFRPLEDDRDAEKYQGQQFCVAIGTAVRLADGSFAPIETIRPGDQVSTLLGQRSVVAVVAPYVAECVRVLVRDESGAVLGEQVHPVWHPVLTTSGLIEKRTEGCSHTRERSEREGCGQSIRDAISSCDECQGTQAWASFSGDGPNDCAWSGERHQERQRPERWCVPVALFGPSLRKGASSSHDSLGSPTGYCSRDRSDAASRTQREALSIVSRYLSRGLGRLRERALSAWGRVVRGLSNDRPYVPNGSWLTVDFAGGYRLVGGSRDAPFRREAETDLARIRSRGDVGKLSLELPLDALGTTPTRSRHRLRSWVHPYTGEAKHLAEAVRFGTMEFVRFERALVADLCVEEANHYITDTGLINKNTRVYLEEMTNWPTPRAPDKMKATLRSASGVPVRFRATANPGGSGHHWVKMRYIDPAPQGKIPLMDEAGHLERMFIPARVSDNVVLLSRDPGYVDRLRLTGSEALVKAWLEGDWAVVEGAFFDNWSSFRHVTRPFEIPAHWARFRAGDWGSARPFSFGWYAVASEDTPLPNGMTLPRGGLVRYREWYGCQDGQINTGLKLTAEQVARGIAERQIVGEAFAYSVIDPAAFAQDGGPSIVERMMKAGSGAFRPADNKRIGTLGHIVGWDLVRHRFDGEGPERPMFVTFDTCAHLIRTVPLLQHDQARTEDVDTDGEDHAGDELRYACASRPWIKPQPQVEKPLTTLRDVTINRLWKERGVQRARV